MTIGTICGVGLSLKAKSDAASPAVVTLDDLGSSGQSLKSIGCDFYFPACPGAGEVELIMYGRSPLSQGAVM